MNKILTGKIFLIAEIGINHNGDMNIAGKCIAAAAGAGADAVKFQNYRTEDFISDRELKITYQSQSRIVIESQYDLFKRCELKSADLEELKKYADGEGVEFLSTPTSEEGIWDLVKLGVPLLKNGSDYLTNLPLIRSMGETGLPTVLSTGMATFEEIEEAVRAFRETGNDKLVLMHCTSIYPVPAGEVNLARMTAMAEAFQCPVGFSDHSHGIVAAIGAAALGACIIEKHFTLDRNLPGPDHHFSMDPDELKQLVNAVREMELSLGSPDIEPSVSEKASRDEYRLSCVAATELPAGKILGNHDIAFRRPGTGLRPALACQIIGKSLRFPVPKGYVFSAEDFS